MSTIKTSRRRIIDDTVKTLCPVSTSSLVEIAIVQLAYVAPIAQPREQWAREPHLGNAAGV